MSTTTSSVHQIRQIAIVSKKSFDEVVASIEADINTAPGERIKSLYTAANSKEVEEIVAKAVGPSGLMFAGKFVPGDVVKHFNPNAPRSVSFLFGNALFMVQMLQV